MVCAVGFVRGRAGSGALINTDPCLGISRWLFTHEPCTALYSPSHEIVRQNPAWSLTPFAPSTASGHESENPPPKGGGFSRNPGGDLLSQGGTPKYHRRWWA